MKIPELTIYEPGPPLPAGANPQLARNVLLPPGEAVARLADVLGLGGHGVGRAGLAACDALRVLAPRAKKLRRNVEAWLVAFARGPLRGQRDLPPRFDPFPFGPLNLFRIVRLRRLNGSDFEFRVSAHRPPTRRGIAHGVCDRSAAADLWARVCHSERIEESRVHSQKCT